MTLKSIFNKCLYETEYTTVPKTQADFKTRRSGTKLFLLFEGSYQIKDWLYNFDFAATPYRDMSCKWKAHRGFVRAWKSVIPYIREELTNPEITQIITIGYSHGAALACLAQEYIWFNRPDIRDSCYAFAFESPRVFCGEFPDELQERWKNLYVFRNGHDVVTHLPPNLFGFKHIGNLIEIGQNRDYAVKGGFIKQSVKIWLPKCVLEHDYPNVQHSLEEYENRLAKDDPLKIIIKNI